MRETACAAGCLQARCEHPESCSWKKALEARVYVARLHTNTSCGGVVKNKLTVVLTILHGHGSKSLSATSHLASPDGVNANCADSLANRGAGRVHDQCLAAVSVNAASTGDPRHQIESPPMADTTLPANALTMRILRDTGPWSLAGSTGVQWSEHGAVGARACL